MTSPDLGRSWTYGYDLLDRLVSADNLGGTADDRSYAYDDADNMIYNSELCAANPNLVYPTLGGNFRTSARPIEYKMKWSGTYSFNPNTGGIFCNEENDAR